MDEKLILTILSTQLFKKPSEPSIYLFMNIKTPTNTVRSRQFPLDITQWKHTNVLPFTSSLSLQLFSTPKTQNSTTTNNKQKVIGKATFKVNYSQALTNKALDVIDENGKIIGRIEVAYLVWNTETQEIPLSVKEEYSIVVAVREVRVKFKRSLSDSCFIYLKSFYGGKEKIEPIPFEPQSGSAFRYDYPLIYYIGQESKIYLQIMTDKTKSTSEIFQLLQKTNNNHESLNKKDDSKKTLNIKNSIVYGILPLTANEGKKEEQVEIPLLISNSIKVGAIKLKLKVIKKENLDLSKQIGTMSSRRNRSESRPEFTKNGMITLNNFQIILYNQQEVQKQYCIRVKIGNQTSEVNTSSSSNLIEVGSKIKFKRTWEELMEITLYDKQFLPLKYLCTSKVSIKQLFNENHLKIKRQLIDINDEVVGEVYCQINYKQQEYFSKKLNRSVEERLKSNSSDEQGNIVYLRFNYNKNVDESLRMMGVSKKQEQGSNSKKEKRSVSRQNAHQLVELPPINVRKNEEINKSLEVLVMKRKSKDRNRAKVLGESVKEGSKYGVFDEMGSYRKKLEIIRSQRTKGQFYSINESYSKQ